MHMENQEQLPTRQPKAGNLTRQTNLNTTCERGKRNHYSSRVAAYSYYDCLLFISQSLKHDFAIAFTSHHLLLL